MDKRLAVRRAALGCHHPATQSSSSRNAGRVAPIVMRESADQRTVPLRRARRFLGRPLARVARARLKLHARSEAANPVAIDDLLVSHSSWLHEDDSSAPLPKLRVRTVFISDIHLGTAGCNAELLRDFLKSVRCETLYLVGDIIDCWRLKRGWYWPDAHNDVVRHVLKIAKRGTRVIYIPGNHDERIRQFAGLHFGGVHVQLDAVHTTADGRRLWVLHGDRFDSVVLYARWLAFLGDNAYTLLLKLNGLLSLVQRALNLPYWSLSAFLKRKVKNAIEYVGRYEEAVLHAAAGRGVDGVVCGHIHTAEIRRMGSLTYYNDGDWVESCTALVEHHDGRMEIIDWAAHSRQRQTASVANAKPAKSPVAA